MSTLAKVLIVDDEIENLKAIERTLRGKFDLTLANSPEDALKWVDHAEFAAIVSDQKMPHILGTELLATIAKKAPLTTRIILTAYTETKEMLDAINRAEIYRYVTKPWDNQDMVQVLTQAVSHYNLKKNNAVLLKELEEKNKMLLAKEEELTQMTKSLENLVERRTAELRQLNEKLADLAMTDPLTKILNRRGFSQKFSEEVERSLRYKHSLCVAMIDVDHFKHFNDMEGHTFGDEALRKMANMFQGSLRKTDAVGRYGGEEFIVLMPETRLQQARDIAERLRVQVEGNIFQGQKGKAYLTVSIGIAMFPDHGRSADELVKAADNALYAAKEMGRNRIVLS